MANTVYAVTSVISHYSVNVKLKRKRSAGFRSNFCVAELDGDFRQRLVKGNDSRKKLED